MNNKLINLPVKFLQINDTKLKLGRWVSKINSLLHTINMIISYNKKFNTKKKTKFIFIYKYTGMTLKKYYFRNYYSLYPSKYLWKLLTNKSLIIEKCPHLINY